MSRYCFIASDDGELPRVDHHAPDKKNRIVFKSFDEAEDLFIAKTPIKKTCEDVKYYTELPFVYVLAFGNAISRRKYKETLKEGLESQFKINLHIDALSMAELMGLFDEHESLRIKLYGEGR